MVVEGHKNLGISEKVYFILEYSLGDFCFIHQGVLKREILLVQDCLISMEGDRVNFGLYVIVNTKDNTIDFYDAYFCKEVQIPDELIKKSQNPFRPFFMGAIYGNYTGVEEEINTDEYVLDIDDYSGVIRGIINPNDCLFSRFNQILIKNSDNLKSYICYIDELIGNYKYENGKIIKIQSLEDCIRWKEIVELKHKIALIRDYETIFHPININKRIFENFEDINILQNEIKTYKQQYKQLIEEIKNIQDNIQEIKYQDFLKRNEEYLKRNEFKYYSSLCLLIKNENEYLKEWLDHHDKIGIEHFYIYDNDSEIPVEQIIKDYKNGYYLNKTTIIKWNGKFKHMQHECYEHCLLNFGNDTRWLGFVDTDEFMETNENINDLLSEYEEDFCLWVPWEVYNSNGHIDKPQTTQKEAYTKTIVNPFGIYGKVFLQPYRTKKMYVHLAQPKSKFDKIVNNTHIRHLDSLYDLHLQYYGSNQNRKMFERIKCNHYVTRSFEEWKNKILRGSCDPNFRRKFITYFSYNPELEYLKEDPEIIKILNSVQPYEE